MAARWRASEDAQLTRLYAGGVPLAEIAHRLGRSQEAVGARRRALGMPARRVRPSWSEPQDRLVILATAAGLPAAEIAQRLGRSPQQVISRRRRLVGVRTAPGRYRPWEDEAIRAAWRGELDLTELSRQLGRSAGALTLRARTLGLHRPAPRRRWSEAEDHALRDGYSGGLSCEEISRRELPHRSPGAIAARARKLGLTSYGRLWTPSEDERLRRLIAQGVAIERIAQALTRTPEAIRQRARRLAAGRPSSAEHRQGGRRWSATEDELLRAHPGAHPALLSSILQRSDQAIAQRQRALGIRSASRSPHRAAPATPAGFSPAEDRLLRRELNGGPSRARALSRRLQRPTGELRRRARELSASADARASELQTAVGVARGRKVDGRR